MNNVTHCGYVALIGRPNVGKSTLLNRLLGQKLSITSRKPQTTRHRILGIQTLENQQIVFVDTPGIHKQTQHALNQYMVSAATSTMEDVDVLIFVVDARYWTHEDDNVLERLQTIRKHHPKMPVLLVLNKVDRVLDKQSLLPQLESWQQKFEFAEMIPLSAKSGFNVENLQKALTKYIPEGPFFFPEDQVSDRSERFFAAEMVREKLMRYTGDEVPYGLTVEIEEFKLKNNILHVSALIWVERAGQKTIIIGKEGAMMKEIGRLARLDMERMFEHKVFLRLWVKVKEGWSDDARALKSLGYEG
ncbi:GTPase Era [soil metagenome]